ncbi:MAG: phage tail protein [Candidatus Polarisedimenticolia bacterium]
MTWTKARKQVAILLSAVLVAAITATMGLEETPTNLESAESLLRIPAGFVYALERDGVVTGYFTACEGLSSETEVIEFREGGETGIVRKLPGRVKYGDITLKRGISSDLMLWNWREDVISGEGGFRSQATIRMLNRAGVEVAAWNLTGAWPSKVSGPELNADGNDVGIESIVLVHEGLHRPR